MKRNNLGVLIIALLCLFIGVKEVKAETTYYLKDVNENNECSNMSNGMGKTCNLKLVVEGGNVSFDNNKIKIVFTLTGATFAKDEVSLSSGWTVSSINDTSITISSTRSSFEPGTYDIGTFNFYKIASASVCNVKFSLDSVIKCGEENGKYYDSDGNEVSRSEYLVSCFNIPACRSVDLVVNGEKVTIYFGKDRTEVTKEQYEQECFTDVPICSIKNGIYYGINGSEISKEEYIKQCEFPCTKLEDGTFIGKDNTIVSETDYNTQCKYHCEYAYGKYYDKDGNETTKLNYEKTCFKNVCKKLSDGTYYNSKGEETDELTYQKECEKNVCKVLSDGTYYDNNGKVVTKEEYEKACNTCKEENGKYYDKEGKETTKENFELVCKVHKCQVINNTYFDDKGNIVTKEVYDKYCTNPKTGNIVPYIYTFLGILTATGLFVYSKKHKKLNRI